MNTNLLLAMACLKQANSYILKAEKEYYLNDLVAENNQAILSLQNAIDAIDYALAGVIDDVEAAHKSLNKKPTVVNLSDYIK